VFDGPRKSRYLLNLTLDVKYNAKGSGKKPERLRDILSAVFEVNQDVKFAVSYRHALRLVALLSVAPSISRLPCCQSWRRRWGIALTAYPVAEDERGTRLARQGDQDSLHA
jgi:hypothetical protein